MPEKLFYQFDTVYYMPAVITVKIPPEIKQRLVELARKENMTVSEIVRRALSLYLSDKNNNVTADWSDDRLTKICSFKLWGDLLNEVDLYAINHRIPRSQVIRNAIAYYLEFF